MTTSARLELRLVKLKKMNRVAKGKQIGRGHIMGDKGIALIHRIVLDMGHVWNPTNLEAGIDGYIELRDDNTGEVTNCVLQVQSKAGPSWFKAETETTFEFVCDERDLNYWLAGNTPVILVVSRPDADEAYWVSLKDYFYDPQLRKLRKITFDKNSARFDKESREQLATIALPRDIGLYLSALPRVETLTSNLLPLTDFPTRLFRASTSLRFPGQVWEILRSKSHDVPAEWFLHGGYIYAFHDLTFLRWSKICQPDTTENLSAAQWSVSEDRDRRYVFVRLLYCCLNELLYRQGVRYSKDRKHYFFRSTPDFEERKIGGLSVFKAYESKKTPGRIAYYRHRAMDAQFVRFDSKWYLEITPSYHFTHDGSKLSRFFAERLRGIKQFERQNKVHLRQVRLWADVVRQSFISTEKPASEWLPLFDLPESATVTAVEPYGFLTFGSLVDFEVDWGVPETAWLSPGAEALEEDEDSEQGRLFDL